MNFAVQRLVAISKKAENAGKAVRVVVVPGFSQRVVLTFVKARCSGEGVFLHILQVLGVFRVTTVMGKETVKADGTPAEFAGKAAVIRFDGGGTVLTQIVAVDGDDVTLAEEAKRSESATVYVMAGLKDAQQTSFAVTAGGTELKAANGFACGAELGYPLILEMENVDGKSAIEGGIAAFAGI